MTEYYARYDYTYQGGDAIFSVPFSYIDDEHVVVIVNGDEENPSTNFTWLTDSSIQFNDEINEGDLISVRRITPIDDKMVTFTNESILDEDVQNLAQDQVFNAVQEVRDDQDYLNENMTEFVQIKDVLQERLNDLDEMQESIDNAIGLYQDTRDLVEDITETYNDLQEQVEEGVQARITHNLFELGVFDKDLSDDELIGWSEQGGIVNYDDYPTAYTTVLNEYENGTTEFVTDDNTTSYAQSYEGSETGTFYIPYGETINTDTEIFSDIKLTESLGTISDYSSFTSDKYTTETTGDFYVAEDTTLNTDMEVYENNICTKKLGTITGLKSLNINEYESSDLGTFYVDSSKVFKTDRNVYSDKALTNQSGTITSLSTVSADKYSYTNGYFYVPSGTTIAAGVTVYSDSGLTTKLGTITSKGTTSSTGAYYYKITGQINFAAVFQGSNTQYFYTKSALSSTKQKPYADSACSKAFTVNIYSSGSGASSKLVLSNEEILYVYSDSSGTLWVVFNNHGIISTSDGCSSCLVRASYYSLVSTSSTSSSNYICIDSGSKLTYTKLGTVTTDVIVFDNGGNETYSLVSTNSYDFIQIDNGDYETYSKTGTVTSYTITLDGTVESVEDTGVASADGIAFEYKLAANGHKIADIKYQTVIETYTEENNNGVNDFYILDQDNLLIVLPTFDTSKRIYLCVGNTVLTKAGIKGVTYDEVLQMLDNYLPKSEYIDLIQVLADYTETLGDIEAALTEILGE